MKKKPSRQEVAWTPWSKITDTQKFLESCYNNIACYKETLKTAPHGSNLKGFYTDMLETAKQENRAP